MTDQRPLVEKVLDLAVYAPLGLADQLRTDAPKLVATGRARLEERVRVAHWVGEMAVKVGRKKLRQRFLAPEPATVAHVAPAAAEAAVAAPATAGRAQRGARPVSRAPGQPASGASTTGEVAATTPPFEGYDQLAAAQIVQLLGRLPHNELQLIRAYEAASRRRRTVLAKIDQLLGL